MAYTAEKWPISAALLQFPGTDAEGTPINDADASAWAEVLTEVKEAGFADADLTDSWVRPGDLSAARLTEFKQTADNVGIGVPVISAIRRSVTEEGNWEANLAYSQRTIDAAAELGCEVVPSGCTRPSPPSSRSSSGSGPSRATRIRWGTRKRDHGIGMRRGIDAAVTAAGRALGNRETYTAAVTAFADAITELGKAEPGDKTMVDALLPFRETFLAVLDAGTSAAASLAAAAAAATAAADATSGLRPLKDRARPLAEKSLGHPDPGAVSFALIATRITEHLKAELTRPEPAISEKAPAAGKGAQND